MDPLDDVPAVVEDSPDVLRVDGAGEVRVAIMFSFSRGRRDSDKKIADEIFGTGYTSRLVVDFFRTNVSFIVFEIIYKHVKFSFFGVLYLQALIFLVKFFPSADPVC